ncbi:MAG: outer membrane beta-barrel protein, partial [Terricaulis sp.]
TDIEFCAWVGQAMPGDRLEYHRGFLGIDSAPAISTLPEADRRRLAALADAAFRAFEAGLATGSVRFGNRDYETIAREDDYSEWEVGADYMLNPHAAVCFRYQHDEVDSPAYRDYEVNQATLGLTLRL